MNYGTATAGGRTLETQCRGILESGIGCNGDDFDAWYNALGEWVGFARKLDMAAAAKLGPPDGWPAGLQVAAAGAKKAADLHAAGKPWLPYDSNISEWGQAQQDLRDFCGVVATYLAGLPQPAPLPPPPAPAPAPAPAPTPPAESGSGWVTLIGIVLLGAVGAATYRARKRK